MAQINKSDSRWDVDGDITIAQTQALLVEGNTMPMSGSLLIDFSKVSHVDTASISLMFEWLRQAQDKKCDLRFSNFTKNLLSLLALYGVTDLIPQISN